MATKDRTALKDEFKNGNLATGERFADLIDSMKVVQEPVVDPAASGTSLSFIASIEQDADGKITATKKTLDLANAHELNPFKGWYKTGDTLPTDGFDGAYLYFKDTSELTGQTTIYRWNGTTYADTGTVVDTSNVQTFESGQAVNGVAIDGTGLANPLPNALAKAEDVSVLMFDKETLDTTNTDDFPLRGGAMKSDTFLWRESGYKFIVVPMDGVKSVTMLGPSESGITTAFVFLKGLPETIVSGESAQPYFCEEYSQIIHLPQLGANETLIKEVPSDAKYLYFYAGNSSPWKYRPQSVTVVKDKDFTKGLDGRVTELEDNVEELTNEVDAALYETKTINPRDTTAYPNKGGAMTSDTFLWRDSNYHFIVVPMDGVKRVTMVGPSGNNARYVFLKGLPDTVIEGNSAQPYFCEEYSQITALPTLSANAELVTDVPSDAKYLYFYSGTSNNNYRPQSVTVVKMRDFGGDVDMGNIPMQTNTNRIMDVNMSYAAAIGEIPAIHELDADGYEIPKTLQQVNLRKKALQFSRLKWTPKHTIVGRMASANTYTADTEVTSIPYGNNDEDWKRVGVEVSIHTFMTAVNNPYSLLYTERTLDSDSKSAWGRVYGCVNGGLYYGTMCCGYCAYISGRKGYYLNNPYHEEFARLYGDVVPMAFEGEVDFNRLQIGDTFNNQGHDITIYGISRDANGEVVNVKYANCSADHTACQIKTRTRAQFINEIFNVGGDHGGTKFTMYRDTQLNKNTAYEASPFVKADDSESEPNPTYNNEICTFAGDKATFSYGALVVLNYNLDGNMDSQYTKIKVYKDGTVYGTYALGDDITSYNKYVTDNNVTTTPQNVISDMNNHCVVLGNNLPSGKYSAKLATAADVESELETQWEVVGNPADISIVRTSDDEYVITSNKERFVRLVCGSQIETKEGRTAAHVKVDYYSYVDKKITIHPKALIKAWGVSIPSSIYLRLSMEGEYGCAPTPVINLSSIDITE